MNLLMIEKKWKVIFNYTIFVSARHVPFWIVPGIFLIAPPRAVYLHEQPDHVKIKFWRLLSLSSIS